MQTNKAVEKFKKKTKHDLTNEEAVALARRKKAKRSSKHAPNKFRNQFMDSSIALNAQTFLYD